MDDGSLPEPTGKMVAAVTKMPHSTNNLLLNLQSLDKNATDASLLNTIERTALPRKYDVKIVDILLDTDRHTGPSFDESGRQALRATDYRKDRTKADHLTTAQDVVEIVKA
eukprot:GHVP01026728.1.p1 GENE.GHVP01026728.1~~GHVP01026728.1.p1  ORF type:complete len:111 (-),score=11.98 GHVP01026728.1:173-505(-)